MSTNNLYNLLDKYERAMKAFCLAQSYRDWLGSKGYNVKCEHFTVDAVGGIRCTLCKSLILCNGRCIHKTN